MIIVMAEVHVLPERSAEALALGQAHCRRSRAEPGCLSHAVYLDPDDASRLLFVEEWASEQALQVHFAVPASAEFVNTLLTMAVGRPRFRLFNANEAPFPKPPARSAG